MENVFDAGKVPYEPAKPQKPMTTKQEVIFYLLALWDIVQLLFFGLPIFFEAFVRLFWRPKKSIAGQVVLITGGGNGIGKGIALRLAREGCNIAIVDIDKAAAMKTANELNMMNTPAHGYCVDVSDPKVLDGLRREIERDLGPVDILINNAGLIPMLSFREGTDEEVLRILQVNVLTHYLVTRTFLPGMLMRNRGHVVGMSSMSSKHPMPGGVIYSSTKYAVQGFMDGLTQEIRFEGRDSNIHCTTVHPYFVVTRKDLMDMLELRFPAISIEEVAECTVSGILRNELTVCVPKKCGILTVLEKCLPNKLQNLTRDILLREPTTKIKFLQR